MPLAGGRKDWSTVQEHLISYIGGVCLRAKDMADAFNVQFGDPQSGWMVMTIRSDETVVTLDVSYVLWHGTVRIFEERRAANCSSGAKTVRYGLSSTASLPSVELRPASL